MDSSNLPHMPSVRLASGVEMQQRWPASVHNEQQQQQQQQKNGEAPRLIEIAPTRGSQGTVVTVVVQSLPHQLVPVKLAFNSLVVDTKQMHAQGITSLVAAVPPFQHTHSTTANVPISICILDKDSVTETWPVSEFIYEFDTNETKNAPIAAAAAATTPTTTNTAAPLDFPSNEKLNEIQNQSFQPKEENFLGGNPTAAPTGYDNFYQPSINNYNNLNNQQLPSYNNYPYHRDVYNNAKYNAYRPNPQARTNNVDTLGYNTNAASALNLFNPTGAGFTSMLTGFEQNESQVMPTALNYDASPLPVPPCRQSGQQQQPELAPQQQQQRPANVTAAAATVAATNAAYGFGKSSVHIPSTSVANYQPYPGLVSRANLKIMGDLDSMAKNWTSEEWEHRRRLVQFWREQTGNEIRCTFDPVAQGERITSNSGQIVVSCIYWAERNDCFITSVDCIHLLESLMDIRFSVEEKNRVRRNLEGFRPLTVSKCKPESADFFKLIMSFPNPKPRNIEKDVKVFPWKTLPYALKKIVTKYTASSYNTAAGNSAHQPRRPQLKTSSSNVTTASSTPAATTDTATTPSSSSSTTAGASTSYMSPQSIMNHDGFYQNSHPLYHPSQQQFNAYPQSAEPATPTTTIYNQTTSIPAFSSPYQQPAQMNNSASSPATTAASPTLQQNSATHDSTTSSSPRLQYPYGDIINPSSDSSLVNENKPATPSSPSKQ